MQNAVTAEQLMEKVELLSQRQRETVYELIDFLLSKGRKKANAEGKQLLLQTSVWSEQDIERIHEAQRDVDSWRIPT